MDVGAGSLLFEERCNSVSSLAVGGSSLSTTMHVSQSILEKITQSFHNMKFMEFRSLLGDITVSNVDQSTLTNASTAKVI